MKKFLLYGFLAVLTLSISVGAVGAAIYHSQKLDASRLAPNTNVVTFFDANNNEISRTEHAHVPLATLPPYAKWAFICVEDKDFYTHNGVALERIAKATYKNLDAGRVKEGASTISQQLIKNTHLTAEKTMQRKIREAALSVKLEKQYSKDEILEMYLNAVYFGNGITGIGHAARFYYDTDASMLTMRAVAGLAGLLRSPARYNPLTKPSAFYERTNLVLKMMYTQKRISKDEYEFARVDEIKIHGKRAQNHTAYFNAALARAGQITNLTANEMAKRGYKIYTFFDANAQDAIQQTLADPAYKIADTSGEPCDTLALVASPEGHIAGMHTTNRLLPTARRNFASALKPLAVYAPAIEFDVVTPDTQIVDEPYVAGDFHPQNYDNIYRGNVTVRESLAQSHNIPAVKILEYTTLDRAEHVARNLGLDVNEENLNLALGVTNRGVTALELLGGYCALANGGLKTSPDFIRRILDADNRTIYEYTAPHLRALSANTCAIVTDMLTDVVKHGTARKMSGLDFPIAAKTGTAQRENTNTDAINISYTPSNVVLVWNCNASMQPSRDLPNGITGGGLTTFMARDIHQGIHTSNKGFEGGTAPTFPIPEYKQLKNQPTLTQPAPQTTHLAGKISATNAPQLSFNTTPGTRYEIYRRIHDTTALLTVITAESTDYNFTDTTAPTNRVLEYWVTSPLNTSNSLKLYASQPINRTAKIQPAKKPESRHWFF